MQLPFQTRFPQIVPWAVAMLNVRAYELADRFDYRLDEWEEDGLGEAKGFAVILPTGLWVLFEELQHNVERGMANGPTIYVLAPQSESVDGLLSEVLNAFGLNDDDVQTKRINNSENWT
jgi:hypothetical protein